MVRAVTDGEDRRQAGLAKLIDINTVGRLGTDSDERLDRRDDANSNDHEVGREYCSVRQADPHSEPSFPNDAINLDAGA